MVISMTYPFEPPRGGEEPFASSRIFERHAWLAGGCVFFPTLLFLRLIPRALRMKSAPAGRLRDRWCSWIRGDGDGLRLALGDSCRWRTRPGGVVPFAWARDACCWWREHRRERREREMAGVSYERDIVRE